MQHQHHLAVARTFIDIMQTQFGRHLMVMRSKWVIR